MHTPTPFVLFYSDLNVVSRLTNHQYILIYISIYYISTTRGKNMSKDNDLNDFEQAFSMDAPMPDFPDYEIVGCSSG
jgi:hypothetical protein